MSMQIITGFVVNNAVPLDNRIVASGSAALNAIPYKYPGLRVFDISNNRPYYWDGTSFNPEASDQVNGSTNYIAKFISQSVVGTSSLYQSTAGGIGINTSNIQGSYTYLQIGGTNINEDPFYYVGQSRPLTIHKGGSTVIGSNWYYSTSDNAFDSSVGSTIIGMSQVGDFVVKVRAGGQTFLNSRQGIYIASTGKVGIGNGFDSISTPAYDLDVNGKVRLKDTLIGIGNQLDIEVGGALRWRMFKGAATDLIQYSPTSSKRLVWSLYDSGHLAVTAQNVPSFTDSNNLLEIKGFSNFSVNSGTVSFYGNPFTNTGDKTTLYLGDTNNYVRATKNQSFTVASPENVFFNNVYNNVSTVIVKNLGTPQTLFSDGSLAFPGISFISASSSGIYTVPDVIQACPDPETPLLQDGGITIKAGELKVGDLLYTIHEKTLEWGNFEVTYVSKVQTDKKYYLEFEDPKNNQKVSDSHKFRMSDGSWKNTYDISVGDVISGIDGNKKVVNISDIGPGEVVKIEVKDAHTYVSSGLISHNIKGDVIVRGAFGFSIKGVEALRISTNKNIGIGSFGAPAPGAVPPLYKLTSQGAIQSKSDVDFDIYGDSLQRVKVGLSCWKDDVHLIAGQYSGDGSNNSVIQSLKDDSSYSGVGIALNDSNMLEHPIYINPLGGNISLGNPTVTTTTDGNFVVNGVSNLTDLTVSGSAVSILKSPKDGEVNPSGSLPSILLKKTISSGYRIQRYLSGTTFTSRTTFSPTHPHNSGTTFTNFEGFTLPNGSSVTGTPAGGAQILQFEILSVSYDRIIHYYSGGTPTAEPADGFYMIVYLPNGQVIHRNWQKSIYTGSQFIVPANTVVEVYYWINGTITAGSGGVGLTFFETKFGSV